MILHDFASTPPAAVGIQRFGRSSVAVLLAPVAIVVVHGRKKLREAIERINPFLDWEGIARVMHIWERKLGGML